MAHTLAEIKLRHHYAQIGYEEFQREYEIIKATPYYNQEFEEYVDNYVLYVRSQSSKSVMIGYEGGSTTKC